MKKLPHTIRLRGMGYKEPVFAELMYRTDEKAMYSVKHPDGQVYHEVFRMRKGMGKYLPSGAYKPAGELYPGTSDFGKTAWCISSLDRAMLKYHEL